MIHIEPIPDDPLAPELVAHGPAWIGKVAFGGCLSIGFFVIVVGPGVAILRNFSITPLQSLPILLLVAVVISAITIWRANVYSRKVDEKWKRRMETTLAASKSAAHRYGYLPPPEGSRQRFRVKISHIDAIWPVDDVALDDLGPGQIVRTTEREYVYCAGEAFAEHDDEGNGVFYLKETITLEVSGGFDGVDSVTMSGRRVPIGVDEVPARMLTEELLSVGFAILDDPELIRRLPPIVNKGE